MSESRTYVIIVESERADGPCPGYHWVVSASDKRPCVSASGKPILMRSPTVFATPEKAILEGKYANQHYNDELFAQAKQRDQVRREARQ